MNAMGVDLEHFADATLLQYKHKEVGRAASAPDSSRQERSSRVPRLAPMLEQPFHACFMTTLCTSAHTHACQCSFSGVLSGEAVKFTPELQQHMKFVRHSLRHDTDTFNYDHLSTARLVYRHGAIAYLAQSC